MNSECSMNVAFDSAASLREFKDKESKRYEYEVKSILERYYDYSFNNVVGERKEYDLETLDGFKIEVKSDYSILDSSNLFAEIWDNLGKRKEGWFRYCNADILAVVGVNEAEFMPKKIYFFDFKALQSYVLNYYFKGNWANTLNCNDEYGYRIIYYNKEAPFQKYMLIKLKEIQQFIKFEFEYPWSY